MGVLRAKGRTLGLFLLQEEEVDLVKEAELNRLPKKQKVLRSRKVITGLRCHRKISDEKLLLDLTIGHW